MVLLQRTDLQRMLRPIGHAIGGGQTGGAGGEEGHAMLAGGGTDVRAVGTRTSAAW